MGRTQRGVITGERVSNGQVAREGENRDTFWCGRKGNEARGVSEEICG